MPRMFVLISIVTCLGFLSACDVPTGAVGKPQLADGVIAPDIVAEPVLAEAVPTEAANAPAPAARSTFAPPRAPRRGVVTAGDIDDTLNIAAFRRYQSRTARRLNLSSIDLGKPIDLQLVDAAGHPAPGVSISLRNEGAPDPFYSGVSDVDGRVVLFPRALGLRARGDLELRAFSNGQEILRQRVRAGDRTQRIAVGDAPVYRPQFLDLAFVIDVSGSMDDELVWLTREFDGIVRDARSAAPGIDIRFGLIAYQSPGDPFVLRNFGFTRDARQMQRWLGGLRATGGAGGAEVVGHALASAVALPWRQGYGERLVFQIGDEPPDTAGARRLIQAAKQAARGQVELFGIGASGTDASFELLMRQAGILTGGRYLFLTDDSGVGLAHGEPDIACYRVTNLTSLLTRVIASEIGGRRVEAGPGQVIRSVGNYHRGICAT